MISSILPVLLSLLLTSSPGIDSSQSAGISIPRPAGENHPARILTYLMRGEVRFLFFWLGRDGVGGGRISLYQGRDNAVGQEWQETEVLFGSNPERVPGKVNMWGYGKEKSRWKLAEEGQPELVQTVFEGFMRPSEEFPSELQDYLKERKAEGSFLYKAIRSEVTGRRATTEIRFFVEKEDFHYRSPERLLLKYQQSIQSTPPEKRRELVISPAEEDVPAGFLTAVQILVGRIAREARRNPRGWTRISPSICYYYYAKPYRLTATKMTPVEKFELVFTGQTGEPNAVLEDVAKVEFKIENLKDGLDHDFTLWFALGGPLEGLPVRILHQPKWWLRLRLDLDAGSYRSLKSRLLQSENLR